MVISFAYLTYHLTNTRTKLYIFSMSAVQNQHSNIKLTLRNSPQSAVVTLLYFSVQPKQTGYKNPMKALARTDYKSI